MLRPDPSLVQIGSLVRRFAIAPYSLPNKARSQTSAAEVLGFCVGLLRRPRSLTSSLFKTSGKNLGNFSPRETHPLPRSSESSAGL
ncbi:MAG: hypothetical protein F6J93_25430 [Oscillatoria sp. SIO1A7]|nr:hypothetical protein [Oscillatoria sp. SIO1A7]